MLSKKEQFPNQDLPGTNAALSRFAYEQMAKLSFNREELAEWFDNKFGGYGEMAITLRDAKGQPIGEKKYGEISADEKAAHGLGTLELIKDNDGPNFIEHFFNEPELLKIAERQGIYLSDTVKKYRDNQALMAGEK
jgi:hypothetical protein